ncbi:MAG: hypothetical protein ACLQIB_15145 [Isosphaeraceae bacterium]
MLDRFELDRVCGNASLSRTLFLQLRVRMSVEGDRADPPAAGGAAAAAVPGVRRPIPRGRIPPIDARQRQVARRKNR